MNNRDFRCWLHGHMEISKSKRFTPTQVCIIRDHIEIVEEPDGFVHWLRGVLDMAPIFGYTKSAKLYEIVKETVAGFFIKETPERKEEIKEACDAVKPGPIPFDQGKLEKILEDIEKGVPPDKRILPLVVGPPAPFVLGGEKYVDDRTVYCGRLDYNLNPDMVYRGRSC